MRSAIFACALLLLPAAAEASTQSGGATAVVTKFYSWYLAQHGDVDWYAPQNGHVDWHAAMQHHTAKYFQAQPFFHPVLFDLLDETYLKAIGDNTPPIYVSTTPTHDQARMSSFDPYVGAASAAASYRVGSSWAGRVNVGGAGSGQLREVTFVPVTFAFAGTRSTTQVTVVVRENRGAFQIYNIHYGAIPFYYAGAISDLQHFLGAYNC